MTRAEMFQTRSSLQTANAGADRHQQHSLPVPVRRQPLAGGPHGETSHISVDKVGVALGLFFYDGSICAGLSGGFDRTRGSGRLHKDFIQ